MAILLQYSTLSNNSSSNAALSNVTIHELGKQLLKVAANGNADDLKTLLSKGAPFTADWVSISLDERNLLH